MRTCRRWHISLQTWNVVLLSSGIPLGNYSSWCRNGLKQRSWGALEISGVPDSDPVKGDPLEVGFPVRLGNTLALLNQQILPLRYTTNSFLWRLVHSVNNYWTLISQGGIWRCDSIRKGWCGCPRPHGRYYRSAMSHLPTELLQFPLPLPPITTPRPISWNSHHSVPEPPKCHCRLTLSSPPAKDHQDTPGVRVMSITCCGSREQGHGEPAHPRRRVLGEAGGGVRAGECGEGQGSRSLSGPDAVR